MLESPCPVTSGAYVSKPRSWSSRDMDRNPYARPPTPCTNTTGTSRVDSPSLGIATPRLYDHSTPAPTLARSIDCDKTSTSCPVFSSNTFSYVGVARAREARRRRAIEVMFRARPGASVGARAREAVRMTTSTRDSMCGDVLCLTTRHSTTSTDGRRRRERSDRRALIETTRVFPRVVARGSLSSRTTRARGFDSLFDFKSHRRASVEDAVTREHAAQDAETSRDDARARVRQDARAEDRARWV